jgi:hypothetical protein
MIEVGILKNFNSGTYKAGVQLAGSLTTYFDNINVARNIPSAAMVVGNYVIVAIPGGNPKDACVIATWPGGTPGGGMEVHGNEYHDPDYATAAALAAHAALNTGAHGVGSNYLAHTGLFVPIAGEFLRQVHLTESSPFTAKINGAPTSTSVVYDTDTNEGSVKGIQSGASYYGRIVLHNTTRGNSRKIVQVNITTNTIITEESADDWADNDDITTQSQVNAEAGYFDVDLSAEIPAAAKFVAIFVLYQELAGLADDNSRTLLYHPYETYGVGKRFYAFASLMLEASSAWWIVPVVSQRITLFYRNASSDMQFVGVIKGYM